MRMEQVRNEQAQAQTAMKNHKRLQKKMISNMHVGGGVNVEQNQI